MSANETTTSMDRRQFVARAALTVAGAASVALSLREALAEPRASDETLAALDAVSAEYDAAMAELAAIGQELEMALFQLEQCEAEIAATDQQIYETECLIEQRIIELAQAQDLLFERIRASYKAGNTELMDVLLSAASFDDLVSRIYYTGKVSDADAAAIQNVKDIKADLEYQEQLLEEQRAYQQSLYDQQWEYTVSLQELEAYYYSYTESLSYEVQALMAQAQAEIEAAAQAEYEAYLAQVAAEAAAQQGGGGGGDAGGGDPGAGAGYAGGYTGGGFHVPGAADVACCYIGVPYVWGGCDPSGFDCSGLAQWSYGMCGYSIGRTTYAQIANILNCGQMVYSLDYCYRGDLLFPHEGHVVIYLGGGSIVHAPLPGDVVKVDNVYFGFWCGGCPVG